MLKMRHYTCDLQSCKRAREWNRQVGFESFDIRTAKGRNNDGWNYEYRFGVYG